MTASSVPSNALRLCALSQSLIANGETGKALQALLRAVAEDPGCFDAHRLTFRFICQVAADQASHLGQLWADAAAPRLGLDLALHVLMETFADHPERYELFYAASNVAMRLGRTEMAEELFFCCLDPTPEGDWPVDDVRAKYDDGAASYDSDSLHLDTAQHFLAAAERHLNGTSNLTLVDCACGTGALASGLRPHAKDLIGLELSPKMAAQAQRHYDRIIVGDMREALASLGPVADGIVCSGAVYYFHDLSAFLKGASAALKPGGTLLFSDFAAPEGQGVMVTVRGTKRYCRSPDLLRRLAEAAGLTETEYSIGLSYGLPVRFWCFTRRR